MTRNKRFLTEDIVLISLGNYVQSVSCEYFPKDRIHEIGHGFHMLTSEQFVYDSRPYAVRYQSSLE